MKGFHKTTVNKIPFTKHKFYWHTPASSLMRCLNKNNLLHKKSQTQKNGHTVWFHLEKIPEQAKLICGDRTWVSGFLGLGREKGLDSSGVIGNFLGWQACFTPDCRGGHRSAGICHKSPNGASKARALCCT